MVFLVFAMFGGFSSLVWPVSLYIVCYTNMDTEQVLCVFVDVSPKYRPLCIQIVTAGTSWPLMLCSQHGDNHLIKCILYVHSTNKSLVILMKHLSIDYKIHCISQKKFQKCLYTLCALGPIVVSADCQRMYGPYKYSHTRKTQKLVNCCVLSWVKRVIRQEVLTVQRGDISQVQQPSTNQSVCFPLIQHSQPLFPSQE